MTDKEIKKALECCSQEWKCKYCPLEPEYPDCSTILTKNALKLIERQQKEIDDLKNLNNDDFEPITHFFQD